MHNVPGPSAILTDITTPTPDGSISSSNNGCVLFFFLLVTHLHVLKFRLCMTSSTPTFFPFFKCLRKLQR